MALFHRILNASQTNLTSIPTDDTHGDSYIDELHPTAEKEEEESSSHFFYYLAMMVDLCTR